MSNITDSQERFGLYSLGNQRCLYISEVRIQAGSFVADNTSRLRLTSFETAGATGLLPYIQFGSIHNLVPSILGSPSLWVPKMLWVPKVLKTGRDQHSVTSATQFQVKEMSPAKELGFWIGPTSFLQGPGKIRLPFEHQVINLFAMLTRAALRTMVTLSKS